MAAWQLSQKGKSSSSSGITHADMASSTRRTLASNFNSLIDTLNACPADSACSAYAMAASISCTDTFFKGDDMHSPLVVGMNQFAEIYNRPAFTPTAARIYKKATGIEDERQFFLKLFELTKTLRSFPLPADFAEKPPEDTATA
jgi:hypothetical protein